MTNPIIPITISRYTGESFMIGDIEVVVGKVRGKRVHFTVFVPPEIRVVKVETRT